ncbi:LysM peptidoglycan-binding domain-containing protein [Luteococcus sp. H138]|uniref:LysM peptidoglycan-binding domain-containing protein n=1 Tax=unclassified Luteococcus TaxID=2639923 RepID=UPI00313E87CF
MTRLLKGLGSLLALATLVVGAPVALLRVGRLDGFPPLTLDSLAFLSDTGALLLFLLTVVAWGAWLVLLATVLAEIARVASRGRIRVRIPGGAWAQPMVGALVMAVASLMMVPGGAGVARAETGMPDRPARTVAAPLAPSHPERVSAELPTTQAKAPTPHHRAENASPDDQLVRHRVVSGDDLWSLAEKYYGDGMQWRRIAKDNRLDAEAALPVGLVLTLREVPAPSAPAASTLPRQTSTDGRTVTVLEGDNLSALAERYLGDPDRWPEIVELNPRIADPDLIRPGWRLRLPPSEQGHRQPAGPQPGGQGKDHGAGQSTTRPSRPAASPATTDDGPEVEPLPTGGSVEQTGGEPELTATADAPVEEAEPGLELVVGLGTLLAAALSGALLVRRRSQLAQRPPGRRIPLPQEENRRFEAALGRAAARAPEPPAEAPLTAVLLGLDEREQPVLHELESSGSTVLIGPADVVDGAVAAITTGLVLHPWSAESGVVAVGNLPWLATLDEPQVQVRTDVNQTLTELERAVAARRMALTRADTAGLDEDSGLRRAERSALRRAAEHAPTLTDLRADPERWEAWSPQVFVFAERLGDDDWRRVRRCLSGAPVGVSVLAAADQVVECGELIEIRDAEHARLCSTGQSFAPHLMDATARRAVLELFQTTTSPTTSHAPWWSSDDDLPPNLTLLERRRTATGPDKEEPVDPTACTQPTLLLLGPLELHGCRGEQPKRARLQCIEYCAWLQLNPGRTSTLMSRELMVAESTRRSNMSRLRNWLGADPNGDLYLPDAYSGRIQLHPAVTTDWEHLQLLIAPGVNRSSTDALVDALKLVRGAPLADAAPGQWLWAEELRTDMASVVRDVGVVLSERALTDGDTDLARWAAARALQAAPGDELLLCVRIRTEHLAGNQPEVERLVLQVTRQARNLGVDLAPETVDLMQEVMEGRRRSQLA